MNLKFDKIYLINLAKRKDRMIAVKKELDKYNINFERFEAVDGSKVVNDTGLSNGALGCLLSHYEIISSAYKNGAESILIFEDDIEFCEDFNKKFETLYSEVPEDWQFLYLGCNKHENSVIGRPTENVLRVFNAFSTAGYAIKREAMKLIIETIFDKRTPVDVYYGYLQTKVPAYTFKEPLIWQRPDWSDVENGFVDYRWLFERNS